jgi:hypothetical protein
LEMSYLLLEAAASYSLNNQDIQGVIFPKPSFRRAMSCQMCEAVGGVTHVILTGGWKCGRNEEEEVPAGILPQCALL